MCGIRRETVLRALDNVNVERPTFLLTVTVVVTDITATRIVVHATVISTEPEAASVKWEEVNVPVNKTSAARTAVNVLPVSSASPNVFLVSVIRLEL